MQKGSRLNPQLRLSSGETAFGGDCEKPRDGFSSNALNTEILMLLGMEPTSLASVEWVPDFLFASILRMHAVNNTCLARPLGDHFSPGFSGWRLPL